jgi:hypothetical protein
VEEEDAKEEMVYEEKKRKKRCLYRTYTKCGCREKKKGKMSMHRK